MQSLLQLLPVDIVLEGKLFKILLINVGRLERLVRWNTLHRFLDSRQVRILLQQMLLNGLVEFFLRNLWVALQQSHGQFLDSLLLIMPHLLALLLLVHIDPCDVNVVTHLLGNLLQLIDITIGNEVHAEALRDSNGLLLILLLCQSSRRVLLPEGF